MDIRIFIVSNADEGWISNCLKHFMPELKEFLKENGIRYYSARKLFGKNSPIEKWKVRK
jgi:hypothetical protein